MKNPKLLFFTNFLIIIYLGIITFYLFNDFLMFEERHPGAHKIAEGAAGSNETA